MPQDLFIDSALEFEKVASEVALPEDPNAWPNEILQELFKQVPYISDFEPHVVMDRVDAERGYAFGHVEVMNKTEIQRNMDPQAMASAGIKQARIPIVVRDRKLMPFDILVTENSRVIPLTEARLRAAVFRPQAFDVTSLTPGDTSMIGQLYPPYRQNYGFGGGGATMSTGMGKQGSASLLSSVLPTIEIETYVALNEKLADARLRSALVANAEATAFPIALLSRFEPTDPTKIAAAIYGAVPCDVVQITKTASGYQTKAANHSFWSPIIDLLDRGQAVKNFGEKIVLAADMNGTVTVAEGAEEAGGAAMPEADKPALISEFGVYKVQDDQGRHLIGYVFPNLIDVDGKALPMALFTNGSQAALQGEIVGISVGGGASLFEGHPRGHGLFYEVLPNGRAQATVPMEIKATLDEGEGVALVAESFNGHEVHVMIQPNIQHVVASEPGRMCVPETMRWLPLDKAETVTLATDPETFEKTAHPARPFTTVVIRSGGEDSFSIDGLPVEKLASEEKHFLSFDASVFLLAGLGVAPKHAMEKMATAWGRSMPVEVKIGRSIKLAEGQIEAFEKKASSIRELVHDLRVDLLKEAAVIPDPVAVDTILSLGFINPENLGTFIGYLPLIDEAQCRMCELLVASRLGMRDVPTSALEKAIRSTEEVLEGLKVLAFQKN